MDRLKNYIQFINEAEQLKNVLRIAWTSEGKQESTAEHSWRLALAETPCLRNSDRFWIQTQGKGRRVKKKAKKKRGRKRTGRVFSLTTL